MFQGSELIQDLQYFTGAQVVGDIFSDYEDLASADPPYILGQIQSAKITAKESLFKGKPEQKSKIDERVTELENSMQDNMLMGEFEKENILERIGKLRGGLCIIKSGGLSEVEAKENRDRIEDALFAVKAALEDGYVVGGGFALV
jgi:chaperonin GroEL